LINIFYRQKKFLPNHEISSTERSNPLLGSWSWGMVTAENPALAPFEIANKYAQEQAKN
jgi:hypothetical protein